MAGYLLIQVITSLRQEESLSWIDVQMFLEGGKWDDGGVFLLFVPGCPPALRMVKVCFICGVSRLVAMP